jgi:hypothetical protein
MFIYCRYTRIVNKLITIQIPHYIQSEIISSYASLSIHHIEKYFVQIVDLCIRNDSVITLAHFRTDPQYVMSPTSVQHFHRWNIWSDEHKSPHYTFIFVQIRYKGHCLHAYAYADFPILTKLWWTDLCTRVTEVGREIWTIWCCQAQTWADYG